LNALAKPTTPSIIAKSSASSNMSRTKFWSILIRYAGRRLR
jgi:hypothetical protein